MYLINLTEEDEKLDVVREDGLEAPTKIYRNLDIFVRHIVGFNDVTDGATHLLTTYGEFLITESKEEVLKKIDGYYDSVDKNIDERMTKNE